MPRRNANELTPPAEQVERFRRALEALTGEAPSAEARLGVAVSGGADSLALLLLAAAAYPGAVCAATVDHGLRPEAGEEAASVGRLCAALGVPHDVLARPAQIAIDGNVQEQARRLRYALLHRWAGPGTFGADRRWRAQWVAVAHQRNDVAESFLMRARRGAGVRGLARMRGTRPLLAGMPGPLLVRPLLDWSRAELAGIVAATGTAAVEDPSNGDARFDRARMRALLAGSDELPVERLALAAANLRHAEDALEWIAEREWHARSRIEDPQSVRLDPAGLPYELRRRLVQRAVEHIQLACGIDGEIRGDGLDRLLATLDSRGVATIAGVKACARQAEWRFGAAPPRRSH